MVEPLRWEVRLVDDEGLCAREVKEVTIITGNSCVLDTSRLVCDLPVDAASVVATVGVTSNLPRDLQVVLIDGDNTFFGSSVVQVPAGVSVQNVDVTISPSLDTAVEPLRWVVTLFSDDGGGVRDDSQRCHDHYQWCWCWG